MFCGKCGAQISDQAKFCTKCGAPVAANLTQQAEETANQAVSEAENAIREAEAAAVEMTQQAETAVQEVAEQAETAAQEVTEEAETAAQEVTEQAETAAQEVTQQVETTVQETVRETVPEVPNTAVPETTPGITGKNIFKNKFFYIGLGVVVVAIVVALILILGGGAKKYNVLDYVNIEYDGYNGNAYAYVSVDRDRLFMDIAADKKIDVADVDSIRSLTTTVEKANAIQAAVNTVDAYGEPADALSNGDTITLYVVYDNRVASRQKIEFTGEQKTITVEGLEEIKEVDPFEKLNVTFTGVSGEGYLEMEYTGDDELISSYSFTPDKSYGLSNGDVVTLTIDYDDEYTSWYGVKLTKREQQYTVSGLTQYITSAAELSEAGLEQLKADALTQLQTEISSYTDATVGEPAYAGYLLAVNKDVTSYNRNYMYLVYKATVTLNDVGILPTTVYFPLKYDDLSTAENIMDTAYYYYLEGYSRISNTYTYVDGYTDPYEMYKDFVDSYGESYNIEAAGDMLNYVEGDGHVETLASVDETSMAALRAYGQQTVTQYIQSNYTSNLTVSGLTPVGEYLMIDNTEGIEGYEQSILIFVYQGTVSDADKKIPDTVVYYPMEFDGVIKTNDGVYVYSYGDVFGADTLGEEYETKGFTDLPAMHQAFVDVAQNNNKYTMETSESMKKLLGQ
ncbi:MAG: zinc-ribbon domain-containing protein [Oscillospiraceae bacterium]|nr:zinc-ribbon domain-containing protein [Oscillospiraceae bacterium]